MCSALPSLHARRVRCDWGGDEGKNAGLRPVVALLRRGRAWANLISAAAGGEAGEARGTRQDKGWWVDEAAKRGSSASRRRCDGA